MGRPNPERDAAIVAAYKAGQTTPRVARAYGITTERVRQILNKQAPGLIAQRKSERHERVANAHRKPCRVCGTTTTRAHTCSDFCSEVLRRLWRVLDLDRAQRHAESVARWHIANPEVAGHARVRHAQRVLAGEATHGSKGLWFTRGSRTLEVAAEAWRNRWPIIDQFPSALRESLTVVTDDRTESPE